MDNPETSRPTKIPKPQGNTSISEKRIILKAWAARVWVEVSDVPCSMTITQARHECTNWDDLVRMINRAERYPFSVKADAYQLLKRRVNALVRARRGPQSEIDDPCE